MCLVRDSWREAIFLKEVRASCLTPIHPKTISTAGTTLVKLLHKVLYSLTSTFKTETSKTVSSGAFHTLSPYLNLSFSGNYIKSK